MRSFCFILISFVMMNFSYAITWEIIGPCSMDKIVAKEKLVEKFEDKTIGEITSSIFREEEIPFSGNEFSIFSIGGTFTGSKAIETISNQHYNSYGWCYKVNGVSPNTYPGDTFFSSQSDKLTWFACYAEFKNGNWTFSGRPAYKADTPYFCDSFNL